jgi:lipopolysaccharide transport system ATP-binding protein
MIQPGNDQSNIAVRVNGVSKCYAIYDNPRHRLIQAVAAQVHSLLSIWDPRSYYREFWALRDISFSVAQGEAVGIIGCNGAGKSTLLQIIAGTLAPTTGTVEINGTVAALLELGSGFNPEFTGRENVYLNAFLMGLSQHEIDAKFSEIAAFADIGIFIDQPVKTYSSGMLVRLAFAVQTAVKPKVLIVDEALSVGDVFFQAKCMAWLRRLIADGMTILFVSHDIWTVRQLCSRVVLLSEGSVLDQGPVQRVTDHYQRLDLEERNRKKRMGGTFSHMICENANVTLAGLGNQRDVQFPVDLIGDVARFQERSSVHRSGIGTARFVNVQMLKNGTPLEVFDYGDVVTLRQVIHCYESIDHINVSYKIRTVQGIDVVFGDTRLTGDIDRHYTEGRIYVFDWTFTLELMHGSYMIMSGLAQPPSGDRDDWSFIDMVPTSTIFRMTPRRDGMIDGFVVWRNSLAIQMLDAETMQPKG